ncbi:MAG: (Fe-S)-binding protein [Bacteroidales bacterium]|nr:(Fe-S)-binding protein [Bacteroidales bacterium]
MIVNVIFIVILIAAVTLFSINFGRIVKNIRLGKSEDLSDNKSKRWKTMFLVAIGQSKMIKRPVAGIFHIFIYVGFIIVNFEMLEILIDGITGSHRILSDAPYYNIFISIFEFFAFAVMSACVIFLFRRNVVRVKRFHNPEMTNWPRLDGNLILITEILLMSALFSMNTADTILQLRGVGHYNETGTFFLSHFLIPIFNGFSDETLIFIERFGWWFHIVGVFAFLNYIPYSKHFHVFFAFPNTYFSKLKPLTYLNNMNSVTNEVKIAMELIDENAINSEEEVDVFGAEDVKDLNWKSLMDAYTCTECGRCTSVCPANLTGKKLSPRKIVMDTRDRLQEYGKGIRKTGKDFNDNKTLFNNYISQEELWACTTCNACAMECPVNIDPVSIILELRRFTFMEKSAAPALINAMSTNIENNGAPWKYSAADRFNWADNIKMTVKGEEKEVKVPLMAKKLAEGKTPEYLFWVGSAGSYDDSGMLISRNFAKILAHAEVDYACLGTEETDSGDNAKRAGNEFLFQMQAMMNIEVMNGYGVKKIITCDPHDFNTMKNEYCDLGGNYEVIHHTQFIQQLIEEGKINLNAEVLNGKKITFHDPCYLGRGNGEYDAPRFTLNKIGGITEMKRNKSRSLCCGAGGTQMFKEAEKGDKEVYELRTEDALETGCNIIATACPMCMTMMKDGIKMKDKENDIEVMDIAEIVVKSLEI